jgi:hypothetical protein
MLCNNRWLTIYLVLSADAWLAENAPFFLRPQTFSKNAKKIKKLINFEHVLR